jgi:hypothetical protein
MPSFLKLLFSLTLSSLLLRKSNSRTYCYTGDTSFDFHFFHCLFFNIENKVQICINFKFKIVVKKILVITERGIVLKWR